MRQKVYTVELFSSMQKWGIQLTDSDKRFPFFEFHPTQSEAVRLAREAAAVDQQKGIVARVVVKDEQGGPEQTYTYSLGT
ncbi:hypothetical protein FAES_3556 [Fibrella aestuarina BUZ 2]|uniref:DUF2188 domain-containing protein n=2 Tax=Fibrella TaxID=861914 RepID=I0KBR0_9BACT|nr:hypothetical protein FAES_3556 [Fibrella aestuarina BUZ 2]